MRALTDHDGPVLCQTLHFRELETEIGVCDVLEDGYRPASARLVYILKRYFV